jgi:hypothetical protein
MAKQNSPIGHSGGRAVAPNTIAIRHRCRYQHLERYIWRHIASLFSEIERGRPTKGTGGSQESPIRLQASNRCGICMFQADKGIRLYRLARMELLCNTRNNHTTQAALHTASLIRCPIMSNLATLLIKLSTVVILQKNIYI